METRLERIYVPSSKKLLAAQCQSFIDEHCRRIELSDAETIRRKVLAIITTGKGNRETFEAYQILDRVDFGRFGKKFGEMAYEDEYRIVYIRFGLNTDKLFIINE